VDINLVADATVDRVRIALRDAISMTGWRLYKDTLKVVHGGGIPYWLWLTQRALGEKHATIKAKLTETGTNNVQVALHVFMPYMGYRALRNNAKIQKAKGKLASVLDNCSTAFQNAGIPIGKANSA
jgi:hypothetical protein